jgi:competence protein ComEA
MLILLATGLLSLNFFYKKNYAIPILFSNADNIKHSADEYESYDNPNSEYKSKTTKSKNQESHFVELKNFDPNTAQLEDLVSLGIHPKTANTIINFRNKGGKFYKKEDLKKIYGLKEETYKKLEPFISIANQKNNFYDEEKYDKSEKLVYAPVVPKKVIITSLEINEATVESYEQLNGIGPYYAKKIVNFRNRLGGFYSINQVGETFGIPDSVFQSIKSKLTIDASNIKKLNANLATFEELDAHPYIAKWQAEDIIKYRTEKGKINSAADFNNIKSLKKNLEKIIPYISY